MGSASGLAVPVAMGDVQRSLTELDKVMAQENSEQLFIAYWQGKLVDQTCTACDFRTFCPALPMKGALLAP